MKRLIEVKLTMGMSNSICDQFKYWGNSVIHLWSALTDLQTQSKTGLNLTKYQPSYPSFIWWYIFQIKSDQAQTFNCMLHISYQHLTNISLISSQNLSPIIPTSDPYHTHNLPISYSNLTNIIPISCSYLTHISPIFHPYLSNMLTISYLYLF